MTLPTYFNLGYSSDSHFLYVSYVTPGSLLWSSRSRQGHGAG